ncbi:MAG: hypothetical protein WCK02_02410 [Bacteroidota bacterium]
MSISKALINLDWLEMYFIGKITPIEEDLSDGTINDHYQINQHFQLNRSYENKHPSFDLCYHIIIGKQKVGYLFYRSNGKYRFANADTIQVRIDNHILYQTGLSSMLYNIQQSLNITFHSYYRIDIAIDGYNIIKRHNVLSQSKEYRRKRSIRVNGIYDENTKAHTSFVLGASKSDKTISIYPKQQQIIDVQKHYIGDYWKRNGLTIRKNDTIDRVEIRLSRKLLQHFTAIFEELEIPIFLASIFKTNANDILEFVEIANHKHREHLINWESFGKLTIKKPKTTIKQETNTRYKPIIKQLFLEILKQAKQDENNEINQCHLDTLAHFAFNYGLCNWVTKTIAKWGKEFQKTLL